MSGGETNQVSNNFLAVDNGIFLDGGVSEEGLQHIRGISSNVLYLCTDNSEDLGAPGGFEAVASRFPANQAAQVKIDATFLSSLSLEGKAKQYIKLYRGIDQALKSFDGPTTIICKSNTRASAAYSVYTGVKQGLSGEQIFQAASLIGLKWVNSSVLKDFVGFVADYHAAPKGPLLFRQFFEKESSTYTYLLADESSGEGILIDPVLETVARDEQYVRELGVNLKYVLNTHVHADHVTGSGALKKLFPELQSAISEISGAKADVKLTEFDPIIFGSRYIYSLYTPGHTQGCLTYVLDDDSVAFTGDTLLIRGCGRTDFQGGSAADLYRSVHTKIFKLPLACILYPAHDYKGCISTSVREEIKYNPRLTKSLPEFEAIMSGLKLPYPKQIDHALPKNIVCGLFDENIGEVVL